jgi:hypothetical protein
MRQVEVVHREVEDGDVGVLAVVDHAQAHGARLELERRETRVPSERRLKIFYK